MIEFLERLDTNLLILLNSFHSDFFDNFMMLATQKYTWVPFYIALAYLIFRNQGWKRSIFWLVSIGLTIVLSDQLCASIIRPQVERLRPSNEMNSVSDLLHIVNDYRAHGFGFPSCHGSNSAALATLICLIVKRRDARILICLWAVLHVYSRIYLGVHYPGDIIVGILVGIACGTGVYFGVKALLNYFKYELPQENNDEMEDVVETDNGGNALLARKIVTNPTFVPIAVFALTILYICIAP